MSSNGKGMIFICLVPQVAFKEQVTRHRSHCAEHARVVYSPPYKLFLYHAFSRLDVIDNHDSLSLMML